MSFRESSDPGGDAVKGYKCDICDKVAPASMHNSKCDVVGCDGYYTIPVFESD